MTAAKTHSRLLAPPALEVRAAPRTISPVLVVLLVSLLVAGILALTRDFMTFGTETDYLGGFVPEAERILRGEPLLVEFHPPLYSFVLAAVWLVLRDWFASGLLVSVLAGAGLTVVGYALFRRVAGTAAGWGAALGLLASPVFVAYSALATSDVFFTFLYLATFLLAVAALEYGSRRLWFVCGIAAGLTCLTRTNGIAVLIVMLAPALAAGVPLRRKAGDAGLVALGLALPLTGWALYALLSESRLTPALTYGSLAQTYFADPELRYAGPVRRVFEERFHGVWEVLVHDPARMAKIYGRDLLILSRRLFGRDELLAFPLNHLAVPGLLVLLVLRARSALWLIVVGAALHVLLLNFKPFEGRFYLFLAPLFAAAAGVLLAELLRLATRMRKVAIARALIGIGAVGAVAQAVVFTYPKLHEQDALLAEVEQARDVLAPGAQVLALRPHAAFYVGASSFYSPRIDDLRQLAGLLSGAAAKSPTYVYVGDDERKWWAFVQQLQQRETAVAWLAQVAAGDGGGEPWALYEFRPQALRASRPVSEGVAKQGFPERGVWPTTYR